MEHKIVIYYKFVPLADPESVKLWQKTICEQGGLKGRILISRHGINGTLGGPMDKLKAYIRQTKSYEPFRDIVFKWSDGTAHNFPRLSVKTRSEIVAFGVQDELRVDENGVLGGGTRLSPEQVHRLVEEKQGDVVFFDGRNAYEAATGRFKDAVVTEAQTSKDFKRELDSAKYDHLKEKTVVTYCTAGVRCEILSAMMKRRGFRDVYQIEGGIVKYGQAYKDEGLWQGKLYVFDGRQVVAFSDKAEDIGVCYRCGSATSNYVNCALPSCNRLMVMCARCQDERAVCSESCLRVMTQPISAPAALS